VRGRHAVITATAADAAPELRQIRRSPLAIRLFCNSNPNYDQPTGYHKAWPSRQTIKIVLDATRLVQEGSSHRSSLNS
jgi:hypothetical protein